MTAYPFWQHICHGDILALIAVKLICLATHSLAAHFPKLTKEEISGSKLKPEFKDRKNETIQKNKAN